MKFLIIGSGIAGVSAAKKINKLSSSDDKITIVSDESYPFYYRPRLIHCLSGKVGVEDIIINDYNWFEDNGISLKLQEKAEEIIPSKKTVLTDKNEYKYDKLLLANGARSFVPPIPGHEKKNIFTLRNAEDAKQIYKIARKENSAVVIGGGLLGLESAYNLTQNDLKVTVLERGDYLLSRQLDRRGGKLLKKLLVKKGINFVLSANTEKFTGNDKVEKVFTKSNGNYPVDFVLLSTGIRSNIQLVDNTDIETEKGVIVNEKMETNIDDVYAAGDVAEYNGRVYGIWPPSMKEGEIAGENMVGKNNEFSGAVSSYSLKVAGISLISKGKINNENYKTEVIEEESKYKKVFYDNKKAVGVIMIGDFANKKDILNSIEE